MRVWPFGPTQTHISRHFHTLAISERVDKNRTWVSPPTNGRSNLPPLANMQRFTYLMGVEGDWRHLNNRQGKFLSLLNRLSEHFSSQKNHTPHHVPLHPRPCLVPPMDSIAEIHSLVFMLPRLLLMLGCPIWFSTPLDWLMSMSCCRLPNEVSLPPSPDPHWLVVKFIPINSQFYFINK
jgi:hypothetical protein